MKENRNRKVYLAVVLCISLFATTFFHNYAPIKANATSDVAGNLYYNGEDAVTVTTGSASVDYSLKTEGSGSLRVTADSSGNFDFCYFGGTVNASTYASLKFDIISSYSYTLAKTNHLAFRFDDSHDVNDYGKYLQYMENVLTPDTWTTITIPIADMVAAGVDVTAITCFRMFNDNGLWGGESGGNSFCIDNIRFVGCAHKNTEIIDAYPSKNVISGYTGDVYCHDCNEMVMTGTAAPAKSDLNGDGQIDISDLVRMKKHIAGMSTISDGTGDLDYSEDVNSLDLSCERKILLGLSEEAYAVFGENNIFQDLQVSVSSGSSFLPGRTGGREFRLLGSNSGSVLSVKLSPEFRARAQGSDLIVTVEYYGADDMDLNVNYSSFGMAALESIEISNANVWMGRNVHLSDVDFGQTNGYDFEIQISKPLRIAEIHVSYAETGTKPATGIKTKLINNGETPVTAGLGCTTEIVNDKFSSGTGSIKVTTNASDGTFQIIYVLDSAVDVSSYSSLAFDIYVENEAILRAVNRIFWQLDGNDSHRVEDYGKYLQYVSNATVVGKWSTITIPLTEFVAVGTDLSAVTQFIMCNDVGVWGGQEGQAFWIDNIRFEKQVTRNGDESFIGTTVVSTLSDNEEQVVADTSVKYFGAKGTGTVDDTFAFQSAIDYVEKKGGGTVFVPKGIYVVSEALSLPSVVTLRGESEASSEIQSVLKCYYGEKKAGLTDTSFITLESDAGLRNMTVWYPKQTLDAERVTPYAWTVSMNSGATVEDVILVNSYQGIRIGPNGNTVTTVRNLYGTPLKTGVYIDHCVDIARFENINFAPQYWQNFGVGSLPSDETIRTWLGNEATAFIYERVDWTYFWDLTFDGYHTGLLSRATSTDLNTEPGSAGGQIYNANIINCNTGMVVESVSEMGINVSASTICATIGENPVAVKLTDGFDRTFTMNGSSLSSIGGNALINSGSGSVSLMNCAISGSTSLPLIDITGTGKISCINSEFSGSSQHMHLASTVTSAKLINNMTAGTFSLSDETGGGNTTVSYDSAEIPPNADTTTQYDVVYVTKPSTEKLINLSDAPYSISPVAGGTGSDISSVLQSALDSMADLGGGTVYVPAGDYRLDSCVVVPSGVELRGSADVMLHGSANGTTFYTNYSAGNENAQALIALSENAGAYGFRVYHDRQSLSGSTAYPYVFQGRGSDCYIINVMLVNPYYGIDLNSYNCSRHFLSGIYGSSIKTGIYLGGGSSQGIVRDCHFNPNAWLATDYSSNFGQEYLEMLNTYWNTLLENANTYVVGNVSDELLYLNFVYGANNGFVLNDSADVYMMGNSADGSRRGMLISNVNTTKPLWIIASQICASGQGNYNLIETTSDFAGTVNLINANGFGDCAEGLKLNGTGSFHIYQMSIARLWPETTYQITVNIARSVLAGITFFDENPQHDIRITYRITSSLIYGNIFKVGKSSNIYNVSFGKAKGSDIL